MKTVDKKGRAWLKRASEVFAAEIEGMRKTRASLGDSFIATVRLILSSLTHGGKVVVSGVGKSLHVAEKVSAILASTGTCSVVLNPVQAMHGDLGMVRSGDILLALSFSGETDELVKLIPAVKRHGLKVVALTGSPSSSLAKLSDVVLEIPCGREACPFGMAPTTSAVATMAMGDALAMVLVEATDFDRESYALNHPAGAIGKALLLKVRDVMRTGERCAKVIADTSVMNSLLAMTEAQAGSVAVVSKTGKLEGIFTDGDFRRLAASVGGNSFSELMSSPVAKYMTHKPLSIREGAYAAEMMKIFETRHVDDLPVTDSKGRLVGVVDIQDLPKVKVI